MRSGATRFFSRQTWRRQVAYASQFAACSSPWPAPGSDTRAHVRGKRSHFSFGSSKLLVQLTSAACPVFPRLLTARCVAMNPRALLRHRRRGPACRPAAYGQGKLVPCPAITFGNSPRIEREKVLAQQVGRPPGRFSLQRRADRALLRQASPALTRDGEELAKLWRGVSAATSHIGDQLPVQLIPQDEKSFVDYMRALLAGRYESLSISECDMASLY